MYAGFRIEFDNLLEHIRYERRALEQERKSFQALLDEQLAGLDDDEKDELLGSYEDEGWRLSEVFPALQASSSFLLIYSLFETTLDRIVACFATHADDLAAEGVELRSQNRGIERVKNILSKQYGLPHLFTGADWQAVKMFAGLRNVITHAGGVLDLDDRKHDAIYQHFKGNSKISLQHWKESDRAKVTLTLDFVEEAVTLFRRFALGLCSITKADLRAQVGEH